MSDTFLAAAGWRAADATRRDGALPAAAYYINLDTMPHRRKRMEMLLTRQRLTARRVRATTPKDEAFARLDVAVDAGLQRLHKMGDE